MRTLVYTSLALVAFAANSVLCRVALQHATIDPATFSTIRFAAGAAFLLLIGAGRGPVTKRSSGSWAAAAILTLYAIPFSVAYTRLTAGTGSLILFGSVQITMVIAAVWAGERPRSGEWVGLLLACGGLVYLVLPGLTAPPLTAAAFMAVAGCSFGVYSLRGRSSENPLAETTANFLRLVPLLLAVSAAMFAGFHLELTGVLLAIASGALGTGLGYVVWYTALRGLTAVRAAVVQLAVPLLAAIGGVTFLAEIVSVRLVIAAVLILGGIGLTIVTRAAARGVHPFDNLDGRRPPSVRI